jgi:MYXO-CTERM domain-containing protein
MTKAHKLNITGKTAIMAALMGSSSISFAQDAAPIVSAPAQPAAVTSAPVAETAVTPPAAIRTLPTENDVVNVVAAEQAAAESASKRQANSATKSPAKPKAAIRATENVTTTAVASAVAVAPTSVSEPSADIAPAVTSVVDPATATVEDTAAIEPVETVAVASDAGVSNDDLTLFGGIAAGLAAVGVGAAFATRRRRRIVADDGVAVVGPAVQFVAPKPISADPVFQQFASTRAPERVIPRTPVMTRPDVPITDPLFSTPILAGPITDPLFAPRNEIDPPITDPLFAKHDRFAGRARPTELATVREPELVN